MNFSREPVVTEMRPESRYIIGDHSTDAGGGGVNHCMTTSIQWHACLQYSDNVDNDPEVRCRESEIKLLFPMDHKQQSMAVTVCANIHQCTHLFSGWRDSQATKTWYSEDLMALQKCSSWDIRKESASVKASSLGTDSSCVFTYLMWNK